MNASENGGNRRRQVNAAMQPLTVGAFGVTSGIATSVLGLQDVGAVLTLVGLGMLLWGLHRLGRLGPDPPRIR